MGEGELTCEKRTTRAPPTCRYGSDTLAMIEERLTKVGKELGVNIVCAQTNYEGEMCELVRREYSRRWGQSS